MAASLSSLCLNDTRRGQPERLSTSQRGGDQCHTAAIDGGSGGPLSWTRSMDPRWRKVTGGIWEFAKTLIIAFILAQLIMVSVAQAFQVEQYSMEPTLLPHDRVLVDKFLYRLRQPHRGDGVVLKYPLNPPPHHTAAQLHQAHRGPAGGYGPSEGGEALHQRDAGPGALRERGAAGRLRPDDGPRGLRLRHGRPSQQQRGQPLLRGPEDRTDRRPGDPHLLAAAADAPAAPALAPCSPVAVASASLVV